MKIITLWQPWANFVMLGWKTIETRTHNRFENLVGQTIGLHAGLNYDNEWIYIARPFMLYEQWKNAIENHYNDSFKKDCGKILCTAKVYKFEKLNAIHSTRALINCSAEFERFGLFLTDIKKLEEPIPIKGHQGIWEYEFNK